jgi:membrane protease YdiL (CAAX protease family)
MGCTWLTTHTVGILPKGQPLGYRKYMPKIVKKVTESISVEPVVQLWAWILLLWSLYRYFLTMPEWVDELIAKPIVFVLPVLYYVFKKEKLGWKSLGITSDKIFTSIYIGLGFGMMFAVEGVVANSLKNGTLTINPITPLKIYGLIPLLLLSLATAFSEELLSRGFIFSRVLDLTKRFGYATAVSVILFVLLHIPILVTTNRLQGSALILYFITNALLAFINCVIFGKTKSLVAPILVHVFWNMTMALYL